MALSDQCLKYAEEEHYCPHCKERLSCCHTPPFHVGDGLGWGTEVFFICLNDECPLYAKSWEEFENQYGHVASCRYMKLPNEEKGGPMMVGSKDAFTGSVIDVSGIKKSNKRYCQEKSAILQLDTCVEEKNLEPVLFLILDEMANLESRHRACELLADLNDLTCIDPIRNHTFKHTEIGQLADQSIQKILKAQHRKECPYCAEVIKMQAKVCRHCNKEVK